MSRIRIVQGTITKTTGGDHNIYSEGNIVYNSGTSVSLTSDAAISYGDPKDSPKKKDEKRILEMYWTYGSNKLLNKSRFYVDMNLIVKTQNYKKGESITVNVKNEDGEPLTDDLRELNLEGIVDENNMVVFEAVLKDYTLNLL